MHVEVLQLFEGISNATLTAYIHEPYQDDKFFARRPAVIVCPGGAFLGITEKEAEPVALKFLSHGFHAFVLRYSTGAGAARFPAPFIDAAKAIIMVRQNAEAWGIDGERIVLCGFSVGGYVAAVLGATWHEPYLARALNADSILFKPSSLILGYPLLDMLRFKERNMLKSADRKLLLEMMFNAVYGTSDPDASTIKEWNCRERITQNMPPVFLWMTSEDDFIDIKEGLDFIKALATEQYEFHVFAKGVHGMSLGDWTVGYSEDEISKCGNTPGWFCMAVNWLKTSVFIY